MSNNGERPFADQWISQLVAGSELTELGDFLTVPLLDTRYFTGTTLRDLSPQFVTHDATGLLLPANAKATPAIDIVAVYLTIEEYCLSNTYQVDGHDFASWVVQKILADSHPLHLLHVLAILNHVSTRKELTAEWIDWFRKRLAPVARARFDVLIGGGSRAARRPLYRHAILNAMRLVGQSGFSHEPEEEFDPVLGGSFLSHAAASLLCIDDSEASQDVETITIEQGLELIRSQAFNRPRDWYAAIARHWRLWVQFSPVLERTHLQSTPIDVVRDVTGIVPQDYMALAYGLFTLVQNWSSDTPFWMPEDFGCDIGVETREAFLSTLSVSLDSFQDAAQQSTTSWDVGFIQRKPIVRHDNGLLVLDETWLLESALTAPYWSVLDCLKERGEHGTARQWSQAYAEMIELFVEDIVRPQEPSKANVDVYDMFTEEDLGDIHDGKICDIALQFGTEWCLIDVVSAQTSLSVSSVMDPDNLRAQVENWIIGKAKQLESSAHAILRRSKDLPREGRALPVDRICALVVNGGIIPTSPIIMQSISDQLRTKNMWADSRLVEIGIVDIDELEVAMLLASHGIPLTQVIYGWKESHFRHLPLHLYLNDVYSDKLMRRPTYMDMAMGSAFEDMVERLRPRAS